MVPLTVSLIRITTVLVCKEVCCCCSCPWCSIHKGSRWQSSSAPPLSEHSQTSRQYFWSSTSRFTLGDCSDFPFCPSLCGGTEICKQLGGIQDSRRVCSCALLTDGCGQRLLSSV
ncbi:hypothetical protein VZT92_009125 [Zoarces viviparus]|uniref:Secreted protein n=1 Tax=Zoarces viviparus TaxID=48416 RepID=A0AAW1FH18_ZOAVI